MTKRIDEQTCRLCQRPIRSGSNVWFEQGALTHAPCHSRARRDGPTLTSVPMAPSSWPRSWSR
jgi:hypothetical protein